MRAGNSTDSSPSEKRFRLVYSAICKDRTYVANHSAMSQGRVEFHRMCDDFRAELDWIDPVPPFDRDKRRFA